MLARGQTMGMPNDRRKIAVVTGANQGLGFALVEGLCRAWGGEGIVYLTGRSEERVRSAVDTLRSRGLEPRAARLDVTDTTNIAAFAETVREEHGGVDLFFSNAAHPMTKDKPFSEQVRTVLTTSNLATTRLIRAFDPLLREHARFFVVASAFGRLRYLAEPLRARFDRAPSLEALDEVVLAYISAVENGTAAAEGWPDWINLPSKVAQVAIMRVYARMRARDPRALVIDAVCPGLIDTPLSRPWFEDMSKAQTPAEAARDVLWLATAPSTEIPYGELLQHRTVLPWDE